MSVMLDIDFDFFIREHVNLDWGHGEMGVMGALGDVLWHHRALNYAARGTDLGKLLTPPDDPTPEQFWNELRKRGWKFSEDTIVLVSNSHGVVGTQWMDRASPDEIVHFDAHHDLGYKDECLDKADMEGWFDCATWLYTVGVHVPLDRIRLIYPEWRRQSGGDPLQAATYDCSECPEETLVDRAERLSPIELTWEHWLDGVKPPDGVVETITICQSSSWVPPWYDHRFKEFVEAAPGDVEWLDDPMWPDGFKPRWEARTWEEVLEEFAPQIEAQKGIFKEVSAFSQPT